MEDMNSIFAQGTEAPAENVSVNTQADNKKREKIQKMKDALQATINSDPDFDKRLRSLSNSIEVVNSLGWKEDGNIKVDKNAPKEERKLTVTSAIVGYRIRNIGSDPVKYITEEWALGESGKWEASRVEAVIHPGETADLTRQYMTMFCAQPEISFQLANGKIIRGSGAKGTKDAVKDIKAELEAYYFSFSKDADGNKKQINDDEIKMNVGEVVGDGDTKKWVVKPEFEKTFGFLNNPKEAGKAGRKATAGSKYNAQDLSANFVNMMIQQQSM